MLFLIFTGNPTIGILKYKEKYYTFNTRDAAYSFAENPEHYINLIKEKAKKNAELIQLLELHQQFETLIPYSQVNVGDTCSYLGLEFWTQLKRCLSIVCVFLLTGKFSIFLFFLLMFGVCVGWVPMCMLHIHICSVYLWGVWGTPTCVLHAHVWFVDLWGVSGTPTCVLHAHTEAGDGIGSSSLVLDLAFEAVAL